VKKLVADYDKFGKDAKAAIAKIEADVNPRRLPSSPAEIVRGAAAGD
jgi:hypothetical protein